VTHLGKSAVVGQALRLPEGVPSFLAIRCASSITPQAGRRPDPGAFKDLAEVLPAESVPAAGAHQWYGVEQITGTPPRTFRDLDRKNAAARSEDSK
jgi:hypothetical protein